MSARQPLRLELFYDVVSPYSYLALVCLERYRALWSMDLVLRPAFLGGLMKAVGNTPPAYLPARAPYLMRDLGRLSRAVDVPLTLPDPFPGSTLAAMRLLTAVKARAPHALAAVTHALFARHWGEGKEVDSADVLRAVLAGVPGIEDPDALLAAKDAPETKAALKAATDEAEARGAFGFPAMFVDKDGNDELFFGQDRLWLLADELGLAWHGPKPPPIL